MADRLRTIIQDATRRDEFVVVTNNLVHRNGLAQFLNTHPGYISVPEYNIIGTSEDVTITLTNLGVPMENIRNLLNRDILANRPVNNTALEKLRRYPFTFQYIPNNRIETLKTKIDKLAPGKVLDVSHMLTDGSGIVVINRPGARSSKMGSPNLPIVSDKFANYFEALHMLPGGVENYADDLEYVRNLFYPDSDLFPQFSLAELMKLYTRLEQQRNLTGGLARSPYQNAILVPQNLINVPVNQPRIVVPKSPALPIINIPAMPAPAINVGNVYIDRAVYADAVPRSPNFPLVQNPQAAPRQPYVPNTLVAPRQPAAPVVQPRLVIPYQTNVFPR